jgi:CRP/FNR family transcriptional regulator, cyclic AMP receptor protein
MAKVTSVPVILPEHRAALERDAWFEALPAKWRERLLDCGVPQHFRSGDHVYRLGDPPNGMWAVLEGAVRVVGNTPSGAALLTLVAGPGVWIGEVSAFDQGPRIHDAIVVRDTVLLHVGAVALSRLAAEHPDFHRHLGQLVCARYRRVLSFLAGTLTLPLRARIARVLLNALGEIRPGLVNVCQDELAALAGVSRQSANRELKRLEAAGLIKLSLAMGGSKLSIHRAWEN